MRRESKKRRAERPERQRVVEEVFERDGWRCVAEATVPEIRCSGPLDADEIIGRGRGGSHLDVDNIQTLCRAHHDWKTREPKKATERGLSRSLPPRQ